MANEPAFATLHTTAINPATFANAAEFFNSLLGLELFIFYAATIRS
jgi:hypothetical protein